MLYVELLRPQERHWQQTASELIRLFSTCVGKPYHDWQTALDQFEGERMDYIVIRGLGKVLEDAATFSAIETAISPAEIREQMFAQGPVFSAPDLFNPQARADVMRTTAKTLRISVKALEQGLYADRLVEHVLREVGTHWTPDTLLAR